MNVLPTSTLTAAAAPAPAPAEVAAELRVAVGLLSRRTRQTKVEGELTLPEVAAMARLDRRGPTTSSAMAKLEQITPQSMGATLAGLEERGLIERSADPDDGRRILFSITSAGLAIVSSRRRKKNERWARALAADFDEHELRQLISVAPLLERLAESI